MKIEVPMAAYIDGVGEQGVVVTISKRAYGHEFLSFGERIEVEDDFLRRIQRTLFSAKDRILFPLFGPRIKPITPLQVGRGHVALLDASEHFLVKCTLKLPERCEHCFGVCVLGLKMGENCWIFPFAQPEIRVLDLVPMEPNDLCPTLSRRRLRGVRIQVGRTGGRKGKCNHQAKFEEPVHAGQPASNHSRAEAHIERSCFTREALPTGQNLDTFRRVGTIVPKALLLRFI